METKNFDLQTLNAEELAEINGGMDWPTAVVIIALFLLA